MATFVRSSLIADSCRRNISKLFPKCVSLRHSAGGIYHPRHLSSPLCVVKVRCYHQSSVVASYFTHPRLVRETVLPTLTQSGPDRGLGQWGYQHRRNKHRGKSDDIDSDDEDDDDDNDGEFDAHFPEDAAFPDNYKEVKKHLKSLRADAVLGGGLNISRKKIDDYFLESKILLNGEKLTKKSKQMEVGDHVDLITETIEDTIKIKRVRLVKISERSSSKDRLLTFLRAWRSNVVVDKPVTKKRW